MQNARIIPARAFLLSLCLSLLSLPAMAQTAEQPTDTPPPASPPLWANPADLVESRTVAASTAAPDGADILSCPFEALRAAYLSLYEDTDALNVAALESEVFKVCIERQKQVKQLLDNEERLRAQLGDLGDGARSVTIVQTRNIAPASETDIAEEKQDAPEVAATITLALDPTVPAPITPTQPENFREAKSAELAQSALPQCSDRYTSGPVFGSVTLDGGLHAFVFDSASGTRLTVKAGDALPGGVTITRISTADGVVVSEQGVERRLARSFDAPAFDDGGGLLFKTVSMADVYKLDSAASDTRDGDRVIGRVIGLNNAWEALE